MTAVFPPTGEDPQKWVPDFAGQLQNSPNLTVTRLTDGHETRVAVGFKPTLRVWSLTWANRLRAEATKIHNQLADWSGIQSFTWTDRTGYSGTWVCDTWMLIDSEAAVRSVEATFREVES